MMFVAVFTGFGFAPHHRLIDLRSNTEFRTGVNSPRSVKLYSTYINFSIYFPIAFFMPFFRTIKIRNFNDFYSACREK